MPRRSPKFTEIGSDSSPIAVNPSPRSYLRSDSSVVGKFSSGRKMPRSDFSKAEMMKSYIWLQTADGSIEQVEQDVALFCPLIRHNVQTGMGFSKIHPISLPQSLDQIILGVILDYCRFYYLPGRSNLEMKSFNEKFIRIHRKRLLKLRIAAESLQLRPLVDLIRDGLLRFVERSTNEEIRQVFDLADDVTEEDRWQPITVATDDPQVRLLNKLGERKRKELKEKEKSKVIKIEAPVDDRSIDELMAFINGENEGPKETKPTKSKKKESQRKR